MQAYCPVVAFVSYLESRKLNGIELDGKAAKNRKGNSLENQKSLQIRLPSLQSSNSFGTGISKTSAILNNVSIETPNALVGLSIFAT